MKKLNKQLIISVLFFFLFVGTVVANELNFFRAFTTIDVVMAKETIEKDTVITEKNTWVYQMPRELLNDQMITNLNDVIGKTATQTIMPNQFISNSSTDQSGLRPSKDHEFFPIPNGWLVEIQGTLRRYDLINISAIYVGQGKEPISLTAGVKNQYILQDVPVAYVKSSRNEEVTGMLPGDDRLYGTQSPSNIQLSLTLKDFKELEKLALEGYRFVISY